MVELSAGAEQTNRFHRPGVDLAIDVSHLKRMTLGDASLERDVLQLFIHQATILLKRMRESDAAVAGACAHTLKGSSAGIGAWSVASAAGAVEATAAGGPGPELDAAIDQLATALDEAVWTIADLLRAH